MLGCQRFAAGRVTALANRSQWTRPSAPTPAAFSSSSTENRKEDQFQIQEQEVPSGSSLGEVQNVGFV